MKLSNAESAIVEKEKITDYLLNSQHRYGASKARFFIAFGYRIEAWELLAESLRQHAMLYDVRKVYETPFGPRYEVAGQLIVPDGRHPYICTVWQMDTGQVAPRLITAYPIEGQL